MTELASEGQVVGRVLRASTTGFSVGCRRLEADLPAFGALVRAERNAGAHVYGLIYDVRVDDDPFVRQLIAAGDLDEEYVQDQRQRRQVPVEVSVLVVGGCTPDGAVHYALPAQPPATLNWVLVCPAHEVRRFGREVAFLSTVLNAREAPADELLAAFLRQVAATQGSSGEAQAYLVHAGQELARLLARDPARLDAILQRMRDSSGSQL